MEEFTILDGVVITVISILAVFIVLIGLQIVMGILRVVLKKQHMNQVENSSKVQSQLISKAASNLEEDEETKTVAALTALVLANQGQQDKKYHITSIRRIR